MEDVIQSSFAADIAGAIARGYCHPENEQKVLDADLCAAMTLEVVDQLQAVRTSDQYLTMRRALLCLYLEAPGTVVDDVIAKVDAVLDLALGAV